MSIIVAVDNTDGDEHLVSKGRELAGAFDDELHVLHVLSREDIEESLSVEEPDRRSSTDQARDTAAEIAATAAEEYTPVGRIGTPATEINDYVDEIGARYLVVGGRKRTPIGKALFGSVTQSVLLSVDVPIVTVSTDD